MQRTSCNIGDIFNYWTIIDNTPIIKSGHTYIKVRCKCGKEELKCLSDLTNNRSTGCKNCKARDRSRDIKVGDKYKHWTVISEPTISKHNAMIWKVECECKRNTRWVQGNELTNPNRCFECYQCAAERRGNIQATKNGKIGDLTLTHYTKLKISASTRNIEFNVSMNDLWELFIKQKNQCAITGDIINNIDDASLDRINSTMGYIIDNIQWVTYQANVSKHVMSMSELYEFCKKVLNHANQQPSMPLTKHEGSETNS